MAIDKLQEKIRKMKCPLVVDFGMSEEHIPSEIMEKYSGFVAAYEVFCCELLTGLREAVPAVRFDFNMMSCHGAQGLQTLEKLLSFAKKCGYYVLLDGVSCLSAQSALRNAQSMFSSDCPWCFDGYVLPAYVGSDVIRPFVEKLPESGKDLFVVVRTGNRSASEIQDLLTGSRLVHMAVADITNRFAENLVGKSGYSQVAFVAAASSADSLRSLRGKYKSVFLLLDGADYPNANAKNCASAFDRLGHGAVASVGVSVTAAWMQSESQNDYVEQAVQAAQRFKKNLGRYISVL